LLSKIVTQEVKYSNNNAQRRDVKSISSIYRLRTGKKSTFIGNCKSIFITTNTNLAIASANYHREEGYYGLPACITDHTLTNLMWLLHPLKVPDLPTKTIIANCLAATQPPQQLWEKYVSQIDKDMKDASISEEDYYLLKYELYSKSLLMEKTLGDEGAITQGTIPEILREIKAKYANLASEKLSESIEKVKELEKKEFLISITIRNKSNNTSRHIFIIVKVIIVVLILLPLIIESVAQEGKLITKV